MQWRRLSPIVLRCCNRLAQTRLPAPISHRSMEYSVRSTHTRYLSILSTLARIERGKGRRPRQYRQPKPNWRNRMLGTALTASRSCVEMSKGRACLANVKEASRTSPTKSYTGRKVRGETQKNTSSGICRSRFKRIVLGFSTLYGQRTARHTVMAMAIYYIRCVELPGTCSDILSSPAHEASWQK